MKSFAILLVLCGLLTGTSSAQVATGRQAFGSFGGGPVDSINLGSLNVSYRIPVVSKAGRLNFSYTLGYDSTIWVPTGTPGNQSWQPVSNWGWRGITEAAVGYVQVQSTTYSCLTATRVRKYYTVYEYDGFRDRLGNYHFIGATSSSGQEICGVDAWDASGTLNDDSGLVYLGQAGHVTITEPSGATYRPSVTTSTSSGVSIADANGNQITSTNGTQFMDTLNTPALTITGSGTASSPLQLAYGANGGVTATVAYKNYPVHTNFQCTGVGEYNLSADLVDRITLADGSYYSFCYEPTPGGSPNYCDGTYSGSVTGRIIGVTLPTGGVISYSYTGSNNGISCTDGTAAGLNRTTIDGTTQYSRSGSGSAWTTTITDATSAHNQTAINFQTVASPLNNFFETKRTVYAGSVGGTALRTTYMCYNGSAADCSGTTINLPISRTTVTTQLDNNQQSKVDTFYNASYGLVTEVDEYDFGSGGPGSPLRKTITNYAALGNGIVDHPSNVTVKDGSNNQKAYTSYGYDETVATGTSPSVPNHNGVSGSRGNLTSVNQWLNTNSSTLTTRITYDDTGNILSVQDPNGHTTNFSYTDNYVDGVNRNSLAYVTTTTFPVTHSPNAANHVTTAQYDPNTGFLMNAWDQNGNETQYYFDGYLRPSQISYPDGGKTAYLYGGTSQIWTWKYLDSTNHTDSRQHLDPLGRPDRTAFLNTQGSWDMQDTCFDANGRTQFVSYTYQDANGWGDPKVCSGAGDTYSYDALSRPTSITHSDSTYANYAYTGRATQVRDEGNGSYYATKVLQSDGLGRLTNVCEVSSGSLIGTGGTPAACGLDYSGTGFLTSYSYDTLNNLMHADQGGNATRTFTYDSLSRMTSESFPEQSSCTTSYNFDNDNLLVSRVRPAPNQSSCSVLVTTTYAYDELHRLRTRSYTDGTTPTATFNYDESSTWGSTTTNALGRLTTASIPNAADIFPIADAMGRIKDNGKCTPRTCGSSRYDLSYTYDALGNITWFNSSGFYALTYNYNSASQLTSVTSNVSDAQHPGTLISSISYGPFGVSSDNLGNGIQESFGYTARGILNSYTAGSLYSFGLGYAGNANITTANDSTNGNWTYTYDQFNRLASSVKSGVNMSYVYDRFGNRWQQNGGGGPTPQYLFDTNNHFYASGISYDVLGNVTSDGGHTFIWDAENRLVSTNGISNVYDAFGRRVKGNSGEVLYDLDGHAVTLLDATSGAWSYGELYAAGRHVATYSGGTTNFLHTDWLGTKRVTSSVTGANSETCTGLPFGDGNNCTGTNWSYSNFTDFPQDFESSTEHAWFRQYNSTQGRWLTPDPAGLAAVDPTNPQSWNRYAYVLNNPLNLKDPKGLDCVYMNDDGNWVENVDHFSDEDSCRGTGGYWAPGYVPDNGSTVHAYDDNDSLSIYSNYSGQLTFTWATGGSDSWGRSSQSWDLGPVTLQNWYFPGLEANLRNPSNSVLAFNITVIADPGMGPGPAFSASFVPSQLMLCLGGGAGASFGHNLSLGAYRVDETKAKGILDGPSASVGYQLNPLLGSSTMFNSSGKAAGYTIGVPGAASTLTGSHCF